MIIIESPGPGRWTIRDNDRPIVTDVDTDRAIGVLTETLMVRAWDDQAAATRAELDEYAADWNRTAQAAGNRAV